jgi:FG-GAP-like repeat/FG-GAP repeat
MTKKLLHLCAALVAAFCVAAAAGGPARAASGSLQIVTGADEGWPDVRGWDRFGTQASQFAPWGTSPLGFSPYPTYQNGVRVAIGDVNGDGRPEIVTAPGGSAFTELKVFDGRTFQPIRPLLPFKDASWWNGAFVATGDTNGDGRAEIVDGLDAGCCTTLHVVDAATGSELSGFFPFGDRSDVGARVAAADLNGDGKAELLALPLDGTRIDAFAPSGGGPFRSFEPFGDERIGTVTMTAANVLGGARDEVIAAAPTAAGAQVKILDPQSGATLASLFPFGSALVSRVEVAAGDVNGDGRTDIVLVAQRSEGTQVKAVDLQGHELASFFVLDPAIVPGASIAAGDLDGDGKAEIVLGGGPTRAPWPPVTNGPDQRVAVYEADGTESASFAAYPGLFQGGVRVALGDLTGDSQPEIVTAPGPGLETEIGIFSQDWVNGRDRGTRLGHFLAFEPSFEGGASLALGDVVGDGRLRIVVGSGPGRKGEVRVFDPDGRQLSTLTPFGPDYTGGISVAAGDVNGDGRAEIVAGTLAPPMRVRAFDGGDPFGPLHTLSFVPAAGAQVAVADLGGTGRGSIVVGASRGTDPLVVVLSPLTETPVAQLRPYASVPDGIRVAAGDLNGDGRDEIVVAPSSGGDGTVRIYRPDLRPVRAFTPYQGNGVGIYVGVAARVGLPIVAEARRVRLVARKRTRVVVARFRDAAGAGSNGRFRAEIDWGDGTSWNGAVLARGDGVYDVRSRKRYLAAGRYGVTVTLRDDRGRSSIARGAASVVAAKR